MSRWWRAYDGAVDDPKLILLTDKQHRAWFNLCCITSQNGGVLPTIASIAVKLRTTREKARTIVAELMALRLVDDNGDETLTPHNWNVRQFKADVTDQTNAARQKRYRNRHRNGESNGRYAVTPKRPESESDTETDSVAKEATAAEVVGEDNQAKLFRLGKTMLISFGIPEKRTGALIGQWLKGKNDPVGLLAAIQFARDHNVAEPVSYISALLNKKGHSNGFRKQNIADLAFELADEARDREFAAGLRRSDDPVRGH